MEYVMAVGETNRDYVPSRSVAAWFWEQLSAFREYIGPVLLFAGLSGLLTLGLPILVMNIYKRAFKHQQTDALLFFGGLMLIVIIIKVLCDKLQQHAIHQYGGQLDLQLSVSVIKRILGLDMAHRPPSIGGMVNHYREFTKMRDFFTSLAVVTLIKFPLSFLFLTGIWYYAGIMVLIPLFGNIALISVSYWQSRRTKRDVKGTITATTVKQSTLIESLDCQEVARSSKLEPVLIGRWKNSVIKTINYGRNYLNSQSKGQQAVTTINQLVLLLMIAVGAYLVLDGRLSLAALIVSTLFSSRAMDLGFATHLLLHLEESRHSLQILDQVVFTPSDEIAEEAKDSIDTFKGVIRCDNLSYQGPDDGKPCLQDINLEIQPGERVGIVGESASQLLDCIGGLLKPTVGDATLDGVPIKALLPKERREHITLCTYNDDLFDLTLDESIKLVSPKATSKTIAEAAKNVGLTENLSSSSGLPENVLNKKGDTLSYGQQQLVRATRLALMNTPICVLDGVFAGLSAKNARQFMQTLSSRPVHYTTLLRLVGDSLLDAIDRVVVITDTHISFDGSVEEYRSQQEQGEL